ncbi:MAG: twin-arginine translocase subunit TatC [Bacteroidales bacterium]|nr:twin-arginine translocase subunit TatC [Bacteroidales bacterium]
MSNSQKTDNQDFSFWEHLDILRNYLIKIAIAVCLFSVLGFVFKDLLFSVILAPKDGDFITYRFIDRLPRWLGASPEGAADNDILLINTELSRQFMTHVKLSFYAGLLLALPIAIYLIFKFVSPALYPAERKNTTWAMVGGYVMFMTGVAVSYFIVFPFAFRFLLNYQVSYEVHNFISLQSYTATLMSLSAVMGILFELPVLCWLLSKLGVITKDFMRKFRRHAIVVILVLAAIITPTGDPFTLLITSLPIYLLYELSILVVKGRKD